MSDDPAGNSDPEASSDVPPSEQAAATAQAADLEQASKTDVDFLPSVLTYPLVAPERASSDAPTAPTTSDAVPPSGAPYSPFLVDGSNPYVREGSGGPDWSTPSTPARETDIGSLWHGMDTSLFLASNGPLPSTQETPSTNSSNTPPNLSSTRDGYYSDPMIVGGLAPTEVGRDATIDGKNAQFLVYQITRSDGTLCEVYVHDMALQGKAFVVPIPSVDQPVDSPRQPAQTQQPAASGAVSPLGHGTAPQIATGVPTATVAAGVPAGGVRPPGDGSSSSPTNADAFPVILPPTRQLVIGVAAPFARSGPMAITLRGLPGGTPRAFVPGAPLWNSTYNLWSGGVTYPAMPPGIPALPISVRPGTGADQAMRAAGHIMEDTASETAAQATANELRYSDRFLVPFDADPASPFGRTWGPPSDWEATRTGLSQTSAQTFGLDTHPKPYGTVQFTREIPRLQLAGGLVAQLGKASGVMTIVSSSKIDNPYLRNTGYAAGTLEFVAGDAYLLGSSSLGGIWSAGTVTGLQTFGRVGGGVGAGLGQTVIYTDLTIRAVERGDDTAAYIYAGAAIGGLAIVAGAIFAAPVLVVGGSVWGLGALGYQLLR